MGEALRRKLLTAFCIAVSATAPLLARALQLSPPPPPPKLPKQHVQPRPGPPPALPASQAIVDATTLGTPILLDRNWRVGISSDPAAASPDFDDSTWAIRDAQPVINEVNDQDTPAPEKSGAPSSPHSTRPTRYAWFRLHIKLAPDHGPLALFIELPVSSNTSVSISGSDYAPAIFADGRQILPEGPHGNSPQYYQAISRIYRFDVPPSETSFVLAVRTRDIEFGYGAYTSFFAGRTLRLGDPTDLDRLLTLWSNRQLFERIPRLVISGLLTVLAAFLFALYYAQKGHVEYLWLALHELAQAPIGFIEQAGSSAHLDVLWYAALVVQLALVAAYFFFEFLIAFLGLKRRWYIRALRITSPILAFVAPLLLLVGHSGVVTVLLICSFLLTFCWMAGWSLFVFLTLIAAALRRNFEAGLLLIPLVLSAIGIGEPIVTAIITEESSKPYVSPLTYQAGPIPIHFASVADFTGILVIVIIIFVRFLRIHRDQERVTNELAAARSVQELLIPKERLATPGFEVDSIYDPANEVGGDFFHIQTVDGGMLVVIGDVAGKGLKAAMNVSLVMGALRYTQERRPARILEKLNVVLVGTQSFTTCQAIWFGLNGEMIVANAGHLPPYLNSQEIALPGGLPLGVLTDITYDEARFYLHPGDRVLLLSDGVVEARQSSGELFGFDRLRHFSQQSAFYLAEAAKAFGQQDDITVLTIRRQAQAMAA